MSEQQMLESARNYLNKGDPKAASLELRNVLQMNNKNAEAHFLQGSLYLNIGDLETAEKEFQRAADAGWDQQQTQVALARIFISKKEFSKLLEEIIDDKSWSSHTRANIAALRALAQAGLNDPQLAKNTLEEARNLDTKALQVLKTTAIFQLTGLQDGNPAQTLALALSLYPDNTELLLLLASEQIQDKKLSAAVATYQKVISIEPSDFITTSAHNAHIGLARLLIIDNKLNEALATLVPLLNRNGNDPEANFLSGLITYGQGDYNRAEGYIRNPLAIVPDHVQSQKLMGEIKYALQEFEQASHYLSNYLKFTPTDKSVRLLLTQTHLELNQPEQALSTLQPILDDNPKDATALSLLSQIAFSKGDKDAGIDALQRAVKSSPDNITLRKFLVKAYIATGATEQALAELKTFQELSGNTEESQRLTITAFLNAGKISPAILIAKEMLAADTDNPAIIALIGTLYSANNEHQQARKYFNRALQLQPTLPAAIIGLAHLEKNAGDLDKATALYNKLIAAGQGGIVPMLALAELAEQQQRTNDMLSWLEKARTAAPADIRPRMILANYYLRNSQPNKAEIYLKEALASSPEHFDLLTLHARVLIAQKRYNEALPPLKILTTKQPDSVSTQLLLGEALLRLGAITEAREHLQKVLTMQQNNLYATMLMAETEFKAGNLDRSLVYAKNLQLLQPDFFNGYLQEGNVWSARQNYSAATLAYSKAWQRQQSAELAKRLFTVSKHVVAINEAIKPLQTWLNQHPEDSTTRLFLAAIYQSEKRNVAAIREYESVLQKIPDNSVALNNLAWLYSLANDPKALDTAEKAFRSAPENAGVQDTYGWILVQQGQPERGLRLIRQAMQAMPDNLDIRFHLASALIKSGDTVQGKQVLKELLDTNKPFDSRLQAKRLLQETR